MGQGDSHALANYSNLNELIDTESDIQLTINNVKYNVPKDIDSSTTLNYFIRNNAKLKGTKYMCLEGGCGVCIVAVKIKNELLAVNSCLVPIFLCNGWSVITIEGIGGKIAGYNILQKTLAEMNGSQCGYCSPAMIMNMYSLIARKRTSPKDIETSFGSNLCRCTGYRSILDTFQLFSDKSASTTVYDIEDAYKSVLCMRNCNDECNDFEIININDPKPIYLKLKDADFFKVFTIKQIFSIFGKYPKASYILNGGNTAHGVHRLPKKDLYIDINGVTELHQVRKTDTELSISAGVTLDQMQSYFRMYSKDTGFEYLNQMADHVNLIGHMAMRNIGTIGGSLMLKHIVNNFPSDVFLILETAGAEIHILESEGSKKSSNFYDFLKTDMTHKLIYSVVLPQRTNGYVYQSYKIMPRAQNSRAIVNAGFLFRLNDKSQILEKPNIIFGGINAKFLHASKTENYLKDKILLNSNTLRQALNILGNELDPNSSVLEAAPEYRKKLAQALFYKFVLSRKPNNIDPRLLSGSTILERPISSGKTDYDVDKNLWPVNEPVTKLEALRQTSGEAEYVNDIPPRDDEVFCVFALAPTTGNIDRIDAEEALQMDGVLAFYTAKDVPGKNISIEKNSFYTYDSESLFAEKEIRYAGEPYGMLVAEQRYTAYEAVKKVKLIYENGPRKRPLLTVKDVLASNDKSRIHPDVHEPALIAPGKNVKYTIKGNFESGAQYHFTMEPQACICIPMEDEIDVFATTQFPMIIQRNVSTCLGIDNNKVNVKVRRLGGGYGSKISRTCQVACACSIATYKLRRPARMNLKMEEMTRSLGKRGGAYHEYEVGVDDLGKIQYLSWTYYLNKGVSLNERNTIFVLAMIKNCYNADTWTLGVNDVFTDLPCNIWCRAPGSADGAAIIGTIMEHIARVTKQDPIDVRMRNLSFLVEDKMTTIVNQIKKTSDYEERRKAVDLFNQQNRWKKRGIGVSLMKFDLVFVLNYHALVSIYAGDGTVSISHGGVEMGQGINTKVAQIAAYTLGIDISLIRIKPTDVLMSPNDGPTAGSYGSDCCASATRSACEVLKSRLDAVRSALSNPSWVTLLKAANKLGVDLCATYEYEVLRDLPKPYSVYGATVAEVEVDVLTGQHVVQRVDILEDAGISLNPKIDAGQVQGAFTMGMGLWTTEQIIYDPQTGEIATDRTWNYDPPCALDIPVDFRVSFLRNSPNPVGILGAKASGEPAVCMSYAIPVAIRQALNSARADAGNTDDWYNLDGPVTIEKTMLTSLTDVDQMVI